MKTGKRSPHGSGYLDSQYFCDASRGCKWRVSRLVELSKDLKVQEMPIDGLNLCDTMPEMGSMQEFVEHMQKVKDCELKYPILLDEDGFIMDGRHRVAKTLLLKKDTIRFVRFKENPPPCSRIEDHGNE